ncbi:MULTISPECIES: dTDP-4-dehydrorhamnose reductase [unclassified Streptomyces]|uniref:dTDP-4-dehydrorhamnose reductase n=1 Tax=unclassified Streptomyces TaxID=2593676 RepID=UPI001F035C88|nr:MULTISPECIES: dTDP-4-dehydrorhamnose reductase [unclassified Streptomyces]MCH0566868.1 dTDP-4-dehydrorhamnose reductase [Streptomyces sp. MUM 2J]MCH0569835.1 dTDP-4-dehydrorhamnose reductase [Streptomyces sp. MUM 136J]
MNGDWLVTGARGMLGQDLMDRLGRGGEQAVGTARTTLDITDREAVFAAVERYRPAVVVNCAAWTAVDDAEDHADEALRVNGIGPRHLAEACARHGGVLLQVSTDYVFPGEATTPYAEDDSTGPSSVYGRTKLDGEQAVRSLLPGRGYVVRTAWLYGRSGSNFVRTMIGRESDDDTVEVVDDQHGQPTWTVDLADRLIRLGRAAAAGTAPAGIYHGTNSGSTTWYGLAREVFRLLNADPARVRPITGASLDRPAPRPTYSVLGHGRWADARLPPIRDWHQALREALDSLKRA